MEDIAQQLGRATAGVMHKIQNLGLIGTRRKPAPRYVERPMRFSGAKAVMQRRRLLQQYDEGGEVAAG